MGVDHVAIAEAKLARCLTEVNDLRTREHACLAEIAALELFLRMAEELASEVVTGDGENEPPDQKIRAEEVVTGEQPNVHSPGDPADASPSAISASGAEDRPPVPPLGELTEGQPVLNGAAEKAAAVLPPAGEEPVSPVSSPAPKRDMEELQRRIRVLHDEQPGMLSREAAAELGVSLDVLGRHSKKLNIRWKRADSTPSRTAADEALAERPEPPKKSEAPSRKQQEEAYRAERLARVSALHAAKPWLSPAEAASELLMPVGNLVMFSGDLDILWGQVARPAAPVASAPALAGSLKDKVRMVHRMHPTWTATLVAREIGANVGTVGIYLAQVREELAKA